MNPGLVQGMMQRKPVEHKTARYLRFHHLAGMEVDQRNPHRSGEFGVSQLIKHNK